MLYFIEFLRAVATALIANSHFKGVYPNDIISFGGGYGLALFFMISGYLLADIKDNTKFFPWFKKKVVRLYIPLYIVRVVEVLSRTIVISSVRDFFINFIFPGTWFGGSLMVAYVLYFLLIKYWLKREKGNKALCLVCLCIIAYALLFLCKPKFASFSMQHLSIQPFGVETPYLICQFIWFSSMMLGYWTRVNKVFIEKTFIVVLGLILSIAVFLAVKLVTKNSAYMGTEIALGPAYLIFAIALFMLLSKNEELCKKVQTSPFGKLIRIISASSLEIYYIQFTWIKLFKSIVFPLNFLLLICTIVASGYVVHLVSSYIINKIIRTEKRI